MPFLVPVLIAVGNIVGGIGVGAGVGSAVLGPVTAAGVGAGALGTGFTAGALVAGPVSVATTAASLGIGIASAAGAFDPDFPDVPDPNAEAVKAARAETVAAARKSSGINDLQLSTPTAFGVKKVHLGQSTIIGARQEGGSALGPIG